MMHLSKLTHRLSLIGLITTGIWLSGCSHKVTKPQPETKPPPPVAVVAEPPKATPTETFPPAETAVVTPVFDNPLKSQATTTKDYRVDAAKFIYDQNKSLIFKGKMPPLLQGVGVLEIWIDQYGQPYHRHWTRPPSHEGVKANIEKMLDQYKLFPQPVHLGPVIYVDTWLWDKSGKFQLDALTEGQTNK